MRLLHVAVSTNPAHGGPVEVLTRLSEVHKQLGHESEIVCLDAPDAPWLGRLPVPVHALGPTPRRYGYSPRLAPWMRSNRERFDLVVLHGIWDYACVGAWRGLVGGSTPYALYPHGMLDPWFRKAYPLKHAAKQLYWLVANGRVFRDADVVLFTNEEERVLSQRAFWGYGYREQVVAFGTADVTGDPQRQIAAFRSQVPQVNDRRFLLFLSRIHPKKGCDLLIKAFARHAAAQPDLDLVIAGPDQTGWQTELVEIARGIGIANRIHWPGMIVDDAKWGAFRAAEAFVLPSHQENFGIVVAEAMACGKPVLITGKVNIWREVEACGGGLVGSDTEDGITDLLGRFFGLDAAGRAAMGERARAGFEQHFEITRAANDLLQVAGSLARRQGVAARR